MAEKERLFEAFPYPTYEAWRKAAEASLKGAPFEKKMLTQTYEGITLQPLYRQEDIDHLPHPRSLPGFPPYVRSAHALGHRLQPWAICQEIPYATPDEVNAALRNDLERGLTAVHLVPDRATCLGKDASNAEASEVGEGGVSLSSLADLATALEGVDLEQVPVFVQAGPNALPLAALLVALVRQQGKPTTVLHGCIGMDPLGTLAREGTLPGLLDEAYAAMAHLVAWSRTYAPDLRVVDVQGHPYHDGGGSATQELAFALASGVAYLREMQQRGVSVDDAARSMQFSFSLGSHFFMEIAKLRAARMLWAKIVGAFGGSEEARKMIIHARTSAWNKTACDPYVNMLRVTTEACSGVVGGCDSMHVAPFDEPIRPPDTFSRRVARNTQIILHEECHLDRVVDPAGGSWYVESLTDNVGRNAWQLFQEVEKQGGMLSALQAGFPQAQVAETAEKRAKSIAQRRDIFVGTNMYPNLKEPRVEVPAVDRAALHQQRASRLASYQASVDAARCATALETLRQTRGASPSPGGGALMEAAVEAALAGATLGALSGALRSGDANEHPPSVGAVRVHRGAERFETLRRNAEAYAARTGSPPRVFLANMGPIPQHKPRADFTTGFFEVGGFEVLTNQGFPTPEAAAQAALDSGAPIVVICSTDDTYPDLVPPLTKLMKDGRPETVVVLAGYPQDQVDAHRAAGVDDFVHVRANCYEMLVNFQQRIGVSA